MDKSSTKLQEACANGTFFQGSGSSLLYDGEEQAGAVSEYKLSDVIVSSYSIHANSSGSPLPSEQITLGYTKVEWTYIVVDRRRGDRRVRYRRSTIRRKAAADLSQSQVSSGSGL